MQDLRYTSVGDDRVRPDHVSNVFQPELLKTTKATLRRLLERDYLVTVGDERVKTMTAVHTLVYFLAGRRISRTKLDDAIIAWLYEAVPEFLYWPNEEPKPSDLVSLLTIDRVLAYLESLDECEVKIPALSWYVEMSYPTRVVEPNPWLPVYEGDFSG